MLTKVYDPESSLPDKMVPEYVSVTNAYKDGLPYDFDQVRIFTWNVKKHRYETAYRQRNLEGYLPVKISQTKNLQGQPVPVFSITVATSDAVKVDPLTGGARPEQTDVLNYQLEGGLVKRVTAGGPPGSAPVSAKSNPAAAPAHHAYGPTKTSVRSSIRCSGRDFAFTLSPRSLIDSETLGLCLMRSISMISVPIAIGFIWGLSVIFFIIVAVTAMAVASDQLFFFEGVAENHAAGRCVFD